MLPSPQMTVPLSLVIILSWPPWILEYEMATVDGSSELLKYILLGEFSQIIEFNIVVIKYAPFGAIFIPLDVKGLDIAAPEGQTVVSTNDGIITLAEDDLYYTGGTIIIDHGHGVKSIYAHLLTVDVKVGQKIIKGEPIGKVGSTGRSTGPHLHWGVMWFDEYVDPQLLIN